ncbi:hypothetical protein DA420_19095 [Clostridioides difficile]|nr:hypothetical protein [Clostridioides difficile]TOY46439.1 hypothetical protein DA420_19095 [Clostridioides difficile]
MEQLDSKYKLKKFLMAVFRDGIGQGIILLIMNMLEYFKIINSKQLELGEEFKEYSKTTFFKI